MPSSIIMDGTFATFVWMGSNIEIWHVLGIVQNL